MDLILSCVGVKIQAARNENNPTVNNCGSLINASQIEEHGVD